MEEDVESGEEGSEEDGDRDGERGGGGLLVIGFMLMGEDDPAGLRLKVDVGAKSIGHSQADT